MVLIAADRAPQWVYFRSVAKSDGWIDYWYDKTELRLTSGKLFVRGQAVAQRAGWMTIFEIQIDCAANTFTEIGTQITDADGQRRVPATELAIAQPIPTGSSGAMLKTMFCQ